MALEKGVNSYVTLAEAYTYFDGRLNSTAWDVAEDPIRTQALITATIFIDNMSWKGNSLSPDQPLAFPQEGEYFDPKLGLNVPLSPVPKRIEQGVMELALHFLTNPDVAKHTGGVTNIQVGNIKLEDVSKPVRIPNLVMSIVKPLMANQSSTWWRAN